MNYYPHHIGDFNNATRHLTRVERALYRDLIELYYDTEQPLPAGDIRAIARLVLAFDDGEIGIVRAVLDEFFTLDGDVYRHSRCDAEIAKYRGNIANKKRAGLASAAIRNNNSPTPVKQTLNRRATNQEPRTKNQEPISKPSRTSKTPMPTDFKISERVTAWAKEKGHTQLDRHLDHFRMTCLANGYGYANWDSAFMKAISGNWAKLTPEVTSINAPRKPDRFDIANAEFEAKANFSITPEEKARVAARFATLKAMP